MHAGLGLQHGSGAGHKRRGQRAVDHDLNATESALNDKQERGGQSESRTGCKNDTMFGVKRNGIGYFDLRQNLLSKDGLTSW
jgi:hypothetical protein